jgi:hypothetical protein
MDKENKFKDEGKWTEVANKFGRTPDYLEKVSKLVVAKIDPRLVEKLSSKEWGETDNQRWNSEVARVFRENEKLKGGYLGTDLVQTKPEHRDWAWKLAWTVAEKVKEVSRPKEVKFGTPIEADKSVWELAEQEVHGAGERLFNGKNAILTRYEGGVVVEQMLVRDRYTCILASLEMVLAQSGDISGKTIRENPSYLLDLKGEMMDLTRNITGMLNGGNEGTLMLQDRENLKVYLEKLRAKLAAEKISDIKCGKLELLDTLDMDKDGVAKQGLILASMIDGWNKGENAVYMITLTADMSKPGSELRMRNGHEVVVIGAQNEGNELSMVILDPMTGKRKINVDDLVKTMGTSGVIKANSLKKPQEMSMLDTKPKIVWG